MCVDISDVFWDDFRGCSFIIGVVGLDELYVDVVVEVMFVSSGLYWGVWFVFCFCVVRCCFYFWIRRVFLFFFRRLYGFVFYI